MFMGSYVDHTVSHLSMINILGSIPGFPMDAVCRAFCYTALRGGNRSKPSIHMPSTLDPSTWDMCIGRSWPTSCQTR
jgi:hypothetical protein